MKAYALPNRVEGDSKNLAGLS